MLSLSDEGHVPADHRESLLWLCDESGGVSKGWTGGGGQEYSGGRCLGVTSSGRSWNSFE